MIRRKLCRFFTHLHPLEASDMNFQTIWIPKGILAGVQPGRTQEGKKNIDMRDFSDESNFPALFSIGNKLEKSAGKFELSKILHINVSLIFLSL